MTRRLVVLFGAGASYGTKGVASYRNGGLVSERPPLGMDLYERLCDRYPNSWGQIDGELASIFEENFEAGMELLWQSGDAQHPLLDMTRFFAEFLPVEKTHYHSLIEICESRGFLDRTVFASLNYECLLEYASGAWAMVFHMFGMETSIHSYSNRTAPATGSYRAISSLETAG